MRLFWKQQGQDDAGTPAFGTALRGFGPVAQLTLTLTSWPPTRVTLLTKVLIGTDQWLAFQSQVDSLFSVKVRAGPDTGGLRKH